MFTGQSFFRNLLLNSIAGAIALALIFLSHKAHGAEFTFSAYCPAKCCCGKFADGLTATMEKPVEGLTVATPYKSQLGRFAVVNIPGVWTNKVVKLNDKMPDKWQGKRYDVFVGDHRRALIWGLKRGTLQILP